MNKWQIANGFNLANVADAIANLLKITIDSIEELYYCKFCNSTHPRPQLETFPVFSVFLKIKNSNLKSEIKLTKLLNFAYRWLRFERELEAWSFTRYMGEKVYPSVHLNTEANSFFISRAERQVRAFPGSHAKMSIDWASARWACSRYFYLFKWTSLLATYSTWWDSTFARADYDRSIQIMRW